MTGKKALWIGRIMSGLAILFLTMDGVMKFFLHLMPPEALADAEKLAYPMELMPTLGCILLTCVLLYTIPRTSILGAILLTGYLGGAISAHFRVSNPLATHTLFPIYVALFIWGGLYLRDAKLRHLIPLKQNTKE